MLINELKEDQDIEEWAALIEQKCSQALKAMKKANGFLYHGSSIHFWNEHLPTMDEKFIISKTRDRIPANPVPEAEEKLLQAGFIARRTNSIFCTGKWEMAEEYGTPYMIFPMDGFHFTWSINRIDYFVTPRYKISSMSTEQFIRTEGLTNKNLSEAIKTGHAIYINGRFIAIEWHTYTQQLLKEKYL